MVVWDLDAGRALAVEHLLGGWAHFDAAGKQLLTVTNNAGVARLAVDQQTADGEIVWRIGPPSYVGPCKSGVSAFSPRTGRLLVASYYASPRITLFDVTTKKPAVLSPHHLGAMWVDVTADGRFAATGTWQGSDVRIWDLETRKPLRTIPSSSAQVRFSPDGASLAVGEQARYSFWHRASGKRLHEIARSSPAPLPGPIAFSPGGELVCLCHAPGVLQLFDARSFSELARLETGNNEEICSLTFTPDGAQLIAGTVDGGSLHVFHLQRLRRELAKMGLDWEHPPLPPADVAPLPPLRIAMTLGSLIPLPELTREQLQTEIEKCTKIIKANPEDAQTYRIRGTHYAYLGQFDRAISDCSKALELDPALRSAYFWRGRAHMLDFDYTLAARDLEVSLKLKPEDAWCCRHLAWIYAAEPGKDSDPK